MAYFSSLAPLGQLQSLAGQEDGRTIPSAEVVQICERSDFVSQNVS
jgi:hypothetical protein